MFIAPAAAGPSAALTAAQRRERRHDQLLREALRDGLVPGVRCHEQRGPCWQIRRRQRERRLRLRVLAVQHWAGWSGWTRQRFCAALGLDERTLGEWRRQIHKPVAMLGAKPGLATPEQRQQIHDFILLWNGALSCRRVMRAFPDIPKGEITRIYFAWRRRYGQQPWRCLHWERPGAVWAIDYTQADRPIDGDKPFILAVRDLASGMVLDAYPVRRARAKHVRRRLLLLFAQHGAPLVLKSDNGSHFTAQANQRLLDQHGITLLLSPPYYPPYNGACEAGMAALKTLIFDNAVRAGRPTHWTSEDVETARCQANHRAAVPGHGLPIIRWMHRWLIEDQERDAFRNQVARVQARMVEDNAKRSLEQQSSPATIRRHAIAAALQHCGHLTIRSRPIHQLIPDRKPA